MPEIITTEVLRSKSSYSNGKLHIPDTNREGWPLCGHGLGGPNSGDTDMPNFRLVKLNTLPPVWREGRWCVDCRREVLK